jgi:uncharacterized membrane protein YtjA (UPF0391 family)
MKDAHRRGRSRIRFARALSRGVARRLLSSRSSPAVATGEAIAMLHWALVFLVFALVAGFLGFTGLAATAAGIAKILFVIFLVLFLVSLIASRRPLRSPPL